MKTTDRLASMTFSVGERLKATNINNCFTYIIPMKVLAKRLVRFNAVSPSFMSGFLFEVRDELHKAEGGIVSSPVQCSAVSLECLQAAHLCVFVE